MDPRCDAIDDEQFLMDMIASGSATAAGHADDTGAAVNTNIYLNMSSGDEIDQPLDAIDDQEANIYIWTSILLF